MIFELLHKHPFATIPSQCFVADGPGVYEGLREKIKVLKRSGEEKQITITAMAECVSRLRSAKAVQVQVQVVDVSRSIREV